MLERAENKDNLLILKNLKKHYPIAQGFFGREVGTIKAVDGIDIVMRRGETLGLVGESGCGKSTLGRLILCLEPPTEGQIFFDGHELTKMPGSQLRPFRKRMQIIFQDPYSSLNPRQTVGRIIGEGLSIHGIGTAAQRRERVEYLMQVVGLRPEHYSRYPHEFSGGQRQRIGIARALALQPELIICDEPLSALDVSIQAQVINLLQDLQEQYHLTYLFISHDLSVVRHISDWVAVMYLGQIVEFARKNDLFGSPLHPYTQTLLQAIPVPDPSAAPRYKHEIRPEKLNGSAELSGGCPLRRLCPPDDPGCEEEPVLIEHSSDHWVRCTKYADKLS